jgi:hypothetical protein
MTASHVGCAPGLAEPTYLSKAEQQCLNCPAKVIHILLELVGTILLRQKTNWAQHSFPTMPAHPVPLDSLSPGHPGASPTFLEEPIPLVFSLWNGTIMQEGTQTEYTC